MNILSPDIMQVLENMWPFVLMVVIFYFLLYRPQKKQQKKRANLLENLKKGDKVVTAGGIYGNLTGFKNDTVVLKISDKVEITVARNAIARLQSDAEEQ